MPTPRKRPDLRQGHRPATGLTVVPPATDVVAIDIPSPPPGLLKRTVEVWDAFWTSWVATAIDRRSDIHRLHRWIKAVDEYERVMPNLRKARMVRGSTGQPVLSPLAAYITSLEVSIARAETEFGMTPQSRLRLGIAQGEAAMTAERMNRMLDDDRDPPLEDDVAADWEPA